MKEACYIHFGYTNINYVLYKRASEQSISFFLSMPKWTRALFATNQCDQDKRGFNVTDANIGSIGPAITVLTGTHTGGQSSSNLCFILLLFIKNILSFYPVL